MRVIYWLRFLLGIRTEHLNTSHKITQAEISECLIVFDVKKMRELLVRLFEKILFKFYAHL